MEIHPENHTKHAAEQVFSPTPLKKRVQGVFTCFSNVRREVMPEPSSCPHQHGGGAAFQSLLNTLSYAEEKEAGDLTSVGRLYYVL